MLGIHVLLLLLLPVLMEVMMGMVRGTTQYGDDPLGMYDTMIPAGTKCPGMLFCSLSVEGSVGCIRSKVKGQR